MNKYPHTAIKYQFFSDLPLITLVGIGFQNTSDHAYSWHNLHRHDKHCLLQYCTGGQGCLTVGSSTYTITPGKAFLINIPGNSHYYLPENSSFWEFIYLEFSPETLPLLCKIHNRLGPVIRLKNQTELVKQIFFFYEQALNNKLSSLFTNTKLTYNFWMDLLNYSLAYTAKKPDKINIAKQYIEHNYEKNTLNIDIIADETGYSKYHLCKKFHKQFGISPMKYLQNLRISVACKLLINEPDCTVKKIAECVGFSDSDYFCKVFKTLKGVSPNTFRRQSSYYDSLQIVYEQAQKDERTK